MKQGNKKLRKNASDPVDMMKENVLDPKYKTELCKTFENTKFCPYGNKCRFAHGKDELFEKSNNVYNYKKKECKSFYKDNFCIYGSRCLFKHSFPLEFIDWSFYSSLLTIREASILSLSNGSNLISDEQLKLNFFVKDKEKQEKKRLPVFKEIVNSSNIVHEEQAFSSLNIIQIPNNVRQFFLANNQKSPNERRHIIKINKNQFKSRSNSNNDTMSCTSGLISPLLEIPSNEEH